MRRSLVLTKRYQQKAAMVAGMLAALLLTGCVRSEYIAMRPAPATLTMPATDAGKACWRECAQTTQICENGCRTNYQASVLTASSVAAQVKEIVQQCKDRCADRRDECLSTCN